jgi:predicted TIM-barrel fold metal-dependent hydrolase
MRDGFFVVDAHAHIFRSPTRIYRRPVHFTADDLIASMDRFGVDFSVVITRPTDKWSLAELREEHDRLAADVARYPSRLAAFCWAAPRLGKEGVAEVERCFGELGFKGMKIHPAQEQCNMDDEEVYPFLEVAQRYQAPVTVHTQLAVRGCEPWRLVPLAEDFPGITFLLAHLGGEGGFVQTMQSAYLAKAVPNIVLETSTTVTDPYATFLGPAEILGADRVVLGSDAPLHDVALNLLKLDLLEMEPEHRRLILGGNMQRILRLAPVAV